MAKKMTKSQKKKLTSLIITLLLVAILLTGYLLRDKIPFLRDLFSEEPPYQHITLDEIPDYSGDVYVVINSNEPFFTEDEIKTTSFEFYSELDSLGRCGYAMACISSDIQPAPGENRGDIGNVYPSGWKNKLYDTDLVNGGYIYNRSHLIGWQLTAEKDNEKNLITGTRYFNFEGMLPFENMVDDYLEEYPSNHVMYRVTPIYDGNNLVANGVLMEAYSVEDNGEEVKFCVYIYNVQPGITIDYATGNNWLTPN